MNYYKLISNNEFVGVATQYDFRVYQKKHNVILSCDESEAQYVQINDCFYHANWMGSITTDSVQYHIAEVIRIDEDEYNILVQSSDENVFNDIESSIEQDVNDAPVVDQDDRVTIEYIRSSKIKELSVTCNKSIEYGVDVSLSDGITGHFSLTTQDQLNLITLQAMVASGETMIPYHADGELCRYYSVEDIERIMNAATIHKTFHVTYFNSLKVYVESLTDMKEISSVKYGMEIPVEYQSDILRNFYASSGEINESE